jgi:anti-sigma B factor antagonist
MQGELGIRISRVGDRRYLLSLTGPLDLETARDLEEALKRVCHDRAREVTLDLRELTFLDSSGIRAILVGRDFCERHGCGWFLVHSENHMLRRLLLIAGIDRQPQSDIADGNATVAPLLT